MDLLTLCSRYSILPALSLDGILHLEVLDHCFSGKEFQDFVSGVLDLAFAKLSAYHGQCKHP